MFSCSGFRFSFIKTTRLLPINLIWIVFFVSILVLPIIAPVCALDSEPMVWTQTTSSMNDVWYSAPVVQESLPTDVGNSDNYVSFKINAQSLPSGYAYDLISRGEPGDGTQWVYTIYMLGKTSEWTPGRIGVIGRCTVGTSQLDWISPMSAPLSPDTDYRVIWKYNRITGGELFINNISQGQAVLGTVDDTLSSSFHSGEVMYTGNGRQHSEFEGTITDIYHFEKDLSANESIIPDSTSVDPENQVLLVTKNISPLSIKQGTDAYVTIVLTNTGKAPVHDIEILDSSPSDFPVVTGETQYEIPQQLEPNETRTLRYSVLAAKPGRYVLNKTQVMYAGADGNYYRTTSNAPVAVVLEPLLTSPPADAPDSFLPDIVKSITGFFQGIF
jgi:Translocon-associated protein beta (TRAPB)